MFLSLSQCSSIEDDFESPPQTYQCDFHDRPLILTGWSGNVSIRRYTMKDPSRGTVIWSIKRYAQHCEALPLQWKKGEQEQLSILKGQRDNWALCTFIFFIMFFLSLPISDYLLEIVEKKEARVEEEQLRKQREIEHQIRLKEQNQRLKEQNQREKELEEERERSRKVHLERLERKAAKRKLYETNRLKNLEKRKSQNVT